MKKIVLTMALAIGTLGFVACSDDDEGGKSCKQIAEEITSLGQAYATDPSKENCIAYKEALQAYVDKNCEGSENFEMLLEGLTCE